MLSESGCLPKQAEVLALPCLQAHLCRAWAPRQLNTQQPPRPTNRDYTAKSCPRELPLHLLWTAAPKKTCSGTEGSSLVQNKDFGSAETILAFATLYSWWSELLYWGQVPKWHLSPFQALSQRMECGLHHTGHHAVAETALLVLFGDHRSFVFYPLVPRAAQREGNRERTQFRWTNYPQKI